MAVDASETAPPHDPRGASRALGDLEASLGRPRRSTLGLVRLLLLPLLAACVALAPASARAQLMESEEEAQPAATEAPAETAPAAEPTEEAEEPAVEAGGAEAEGMAVGGGGGYEPDQRGTHEDAGDAQPMPREAPRRTEEAGEAVVGAEESRPFGGFELQLWLGGALTGLDAVRGANLLRPSQQGGAGGSFGFVGGVRLGPVTVGPRVGFAVDPDFVLGSLGGDVQLRILEERFTPFVRASVSYAFLLGLADELPSQSEARVDGVLAELGLGARYRLVGPVVVGAEVSGGYLHLERGAVPACAAPCTDDGDFDLARPGQSDGMTLRIHLWTGVSF